jgi:hypothetical protein
MKKKRAKEYYRIGLKSKGTRPLSVELGGRTIWVGKGGALKAIKRQDQFNPRSLRPVKTDYKEDSIEVRYLMDRVREEENRNYFGKKESIK